MDLANIVLCSPWVLWSWSWEFCLPESHRTRHSVCVPVKIFLGFNWTNWNNPHHPQSLSYVQLLLKESLRKSACHINIFIISLKNHAGGRFIFWLFAFLLNIPIPHTHMCCLCVRPLYSSIWARMPQRWAQIMILHTTWQATKPFSSQ